MLTTSEPALTLRDLTPKDAGLLHALIQANRAHLTAHGDYHELVAATPEMLAAELADHASGKRRFGVFLVGELIGRIDLMPVDPPRYGLGYWLAQDATGRGYATQALAAILELAAGELHAAEVYAGVTHGNAASTRLLLRSGFVQVAEFDTYSRFRLALDRGMAGQTVFSQPPSTK